MATPAEVIKHLRKDVDPNDTTSPVVNRINAVEALVTALGVLNKDYLTRELKDMIEVLLRTCVSFTNTRLGPDNTLDWQLIQLKAFLA